MSFIPVKVILDDHTLNKFVFSKLGIGTSIQMLQSRSLQCNSLDNSWIVNSAPTKCKKKGGFAGFPKLKMMKSSKKKSVANKVSSPGN